MTDDFAPDGQLAKAIPGFKPREPQRQMAVAVTQAIEKGQPLVVEAGTGTGKTFAFLLPLAVRLKENPQENALILSPTRELAQQTQEELKKLFSDDFTLQTALIIGGDNIHKQYADSHFAILEYGARQHSR